MAEFIYTTSKSDICPFLVMGNPSMKSVIFKGLEFFGQCRAWEAIINWLCVQLFFVDKQLVNGDE